MARSSDLHPRSVAEILDSAFRLYRADFFRWIGITLLLQGAIGVLLLVVVSQANPRLLTVNIDSYEEGEDRYKELPALINPIFSHSLAEDWLINYYDTTWFIHSLTFGAAVITNLTLGVLSAMLVRRYLGQTTVWPQQAGLSLRGIIALAFVSLPTLICGDPLFLSWNYYRGLRNVYLDALQPVSMFALVWPVIVLTALVSALIPQVTVLERRGPLSSLWRSAQLIRRAPWRTLALLMVTRVCLILLSFNMLVLMLPVSNMLPMGWYDGVIIVLGVSFLLAMIFLLPFQAAVLTVLYIDLRSYVEGEDLDMQLRQAF